MIKVRLQGGLGNQMFQFAFGYSLSKSRKQSLALDLVYLNDRSPRRNFAFRKFDLNVYEHNCVIIDRQFPKGYIYLYLLFEKFLKWLKVKSFFKRYLEIDFNFDHFIFVSKCCYFIGYFQSYKYFDVYRQDLYKIFITNLKLENKSVQLFQEIKQGNSLCLNVRKGVLGVDRFRSDISYYFDAIKFLTSSYKIDHIYVFSDDIQWCKLIFNGITNVSYIEHDYAGIKFSGYLKLMSACKYFVIPNSTFGWWAAYLADDKNKVVVVPKIWFPEKDFAAPDLIPDSWVRL